MLGGEDTLLFPIVCMGGHGAIAASAHVCTERFVEMIECGLAGKVDDGRAHAEALLPVVQRGFAEPNPAVFKGVLHRPGPHPHARPPPADDERARRSPWPSVDRALAAAAPGRCRLITRIARRAGR